MSKTRRGHRPYAENWNKTCFRCRNMVCNRCVNCLGRASLVHHFYYRKGILGRKVYGKERSLIDIVPLCKNCHGMVHEKTHWVKDKNDPDNDRNVASIVWGLRIQSWIIVLICLPFRLVFNKT